MLYCNKTLRKSNIHALLATELLPTQYCSTHKLFLKHFQAPLNFEFDFIIVAQIIVWKHFKPALKRLV
jgi:hypothetical protein